MRLCLKNSYAHATCSDKPAVPTCNSPRVAFFTDVDLYWQTVDLHYNISTKTLTSAQVGMYYKTEETINHSLQNVLFH